MVPITISISHWSVGKFFDTKLERWDCLTSFNNAHLKTKLTLGKVLTYASTSTCNYQFFDTCAAMVFKKETPPFQVIFCVWKIFKAFNENHRTIRFFLGWMSLVKTTKSKLPRFHVCPIADGKWRKPVMWWIKLQEEKDHPVGSNSKSHYPTKFESLGKTSFFFAHAVQNRNNPQYQQISDNE